MNNYCKLLRKLRSSGGFTLTELLIASALTVVVVGGAGYGLLTVLNRNKIANAASQTQQMLNLGVEFVTDEIQSASQIDTAYDATNAAQFEKIRNKTDIPVLSLKINGVSQRVIYFTRDMSTQKNPTWAGPTVLYRFGPYMDTNGSYLNPTDPSKWNNGDALIDLIGSRQNLTDATASTACSDTSWIRIPAQDADLRGFFVCVRPKGDLAEIRALSAMDMKGTKTSGNKPVTYQISTQVATRSNENIPLDGGGAILDVTTMRPNMPVNIVGQTIYKTSSCLAPKDLNIAIRAQTTNWVVVTTSQTLGTLNSAIIRIIGDDLSCQSGAGSYQATTLSSAQTLKAKNGDAIKDLFPATYTGDKVVAAANLAKLLPSAYFNSATGTIKLPTNQNLFFMSNSGSPSTYNNAIILTTVNRQ